jgi:hypothetical protein
MSDEEWAAFLEAHQLDIELRWAARVMKAVARNALFGSLSEQEMAEMAKARRSR